MSPLRTIFLTVILCSLGIVVVEKNRRQSLESEIVPAAVAPTRVSGTTIRAPGRIAGATEVIELRSLVQEVVKKIHVKQGDYVKEQSLLISLEDRSLVHEVELTAAVLQQRQAELDRISNGARDSEIETARSEFQAANAKVESSASRLARIEKLFERNAASQQDFDDAKYEYASANALSLASKSRLRTLEQPARKEDIQIAESAVLAARANLQLAKDRLDKTNIRSPVAGKVLKINAQLGELPQAVNAQPIVTMCDSRRQRAILEIDEFDALKVSLGQRCDISVDGTDGLLAGGTITEIEPRMQPKQIFGQWAGERNDTFTRRVWVDLDQGTRPLPIGLPIKTKIAVNQ